MGVSGIGFRVQGFRVYQGLGQVSVGWVLCRGAEPEDLDCRSDSRGCVVCRRQISSMVRQVGFKGYGVLWALGFGVLSSGR